MINRMIIVCVGFLTDLCFGDPHRMWHPVQGIGYCITVTERVLRAIFHIREEREADKNKKRRVGVLLVLLVLSLSVGIPAGLLFLAGKIHPGFYSILACIWCYQLLAMKSLKKESMKVYTALERGELQQARGALSMIVGRDTQELSKEGIIKATIETIAENTSDGVIAPLFYMMMFGIPGGFLYKAVNTMDSMIGYRNDRYCYLGTAAAKLDDILTYIPARIAAMGMILSSFLLGMDAKQAVKIYKRDRYRHASPNSAQTEAVCAGALSVQLAGDAYYFGILYQKPTIGDAKRTVETEDIRRANRLLYATSVLVLMTGILLMLVIDILYIG
ncbi:MAG: adenosylcobinamide-phosphate synthase CbiB [Lachnospiraceae bacterium]